MLAARPDLREEAEAEAATASGSVNGVDNNNDDDDDDAKVSLLEVLVAEKSNELRTRVRSRAQEKSDRLLHTFSSSSSSSSSSSFSPRREHPEYDGDNDIVHRNSFSEARKPRGKALSPSAMATDAGWPWPAEWLAAPRVPPPPPRDAALLGLGLEEEDDVGFEDGSMGGREFAGGPGDGHGGWKGPPVPYSIEVASVEVANAEGFGAAHVEVCTKYV